MPDRNHIFLRRVELRNYRSFKACDVSLGPLTFLVGPNGAGKSNFLDALRLVSDSLNTSLDHALRERGGIHQVRRRSSGHPTHFAIHLDWRLPGGQYGTYAFRVGAQEKGGFDVQYEHVRVMSETSPLVGQHYTVRSGVVAEKSFDVGPKASNDRLYLVAASGLPEFRGLYEALSHMGFYNLHPEVIRELQPPDPGDLLRRDGGNLASVLAVMQRENAAAHERVVEYLAKIVPGICSVDARQVASKETLEFRQKVGKNKDAWRFGPENMSDGTLRALGVLTALFQSANGREAASQVPFVGIEEPEAAVHPGAAGMLRDALGAASAHTQVAVTSHSPDLLDDKDIPEAAILAVVSQGGVSIIGPPSRAGREAIREQLYTVGELLRLGHIEPGDPSPPQSGDLLPSFSP